MYRVSAQRGDRVKTYHGDTATVLVVDQEKRAVFVKIDGKNHTTGWFYFESLIWIEE